MVRGGVSFSQIVVKILPSGVFIFDKVAITAIMTLLSYTPAFTRALRNFSILAVLACLALPVHAQGLSDAHKQKLDEISTYLNTLVKVKGSFAQTNWNGSGSTGDFYLQRPGRLRFDYHAPYDDDIMIVDSGTVAIFDKFSNPDPKQLPLSRTPLAPFLQRNVDFANSNFIYQMIDNGDTISVFARDPKLPELGFAEIIFGNDPVVLQGWAMTDNRNIVTRVRLGTIEATNDLPARLFSINRIVSERRDRKGEN